jgi:hypothetical protein
MVRPGSIPNTNFTNFMLFGVRDKKEFEMSKLILGQSSTDGEVRIHIVDRYRTNEKRADYDSQIANQREHDCEGWATLC